VSPNWTGYVVRGGPYVQVSASWRVANGSSSGPWQGSAQWIGIGGWNTGPLLQTGTELQASTNTYACGFLLLDRCSRPTTQFYAWIEDYPAPSNVIFPVAVGDTIQADISKAPGQGWVVNIYDLNNRRQKNEFEPTFGADQSSAEWIVEAPGLPVPVPTGGIYSIAPPPQNLAPTAAVTFMNARAVEGGRTVGPSDGQAVQMVKNGLAQAVALPTGSGSFSVYTRQ